MSITHYLLLKTLHTIFSCCTHFSYIKSHKHQPTTHLVVKTLHTMISVEHTSHIQSQSINLQCTNSQISIHSRLVSNLSWPHRWSHSELTTWLICCLGQCEIPFYTLFPSTLFSFPESYRGVLFILEVDGIWMELTEPGLTALGHGGGLWQCESPVGALWYNSSHCC